MDIKDKITEQPSRFDHLEQMSVSELLQHINEEDSRVADAVHEALPQIQAFIEAVEQRMKRGGRLFYVGAGTSGRLGVLDASELPPTFGAPYRLVKTLQQFAEVYGADRQVSVCREISKVHEESVRGSLEEVIAHFTEKEPKGEIVIILAGCDKNDKVKISN